MELHTTPRRCWVCSDPHQRTTMLCGSCFGKTLVVLSDEEAWLCERLAKIANGPGLHAHVAAAARLARGETPTLDERLRVGALAYLLAEFLEVHGLQEKGLDTLYRKLMQHDRKTLQPAPFPPLNMSC